MEGFHQSSQQGLEALTAQQEDTKALLRKLANFFGEDPNVAKPDMILGRVADLLDKLSGASEAVPSRSQDIDQW